MIQIRNRQGILGDPTQYFSVQGSQCPEDSIRSQLFLADRYATAEVTRGVTDCLVAFHAPRQGVDAVRTAYDCRLIECVGR